MPKANLAAVGGSAKTPNAIDSFINQASRKGRTGTPCWHEILPEDARLAIEQLEVRMAAGEHFQWQSISEALMDNFGIETRANGIARHYQNKCRCG